jgi:putative transposase
MKSLKPQPGAGGFQPPPSASNNSRATEVPQSTNGDCKSPARASVQLAPQRPDSVFFNKDAPLRRYRNWLPHWRQPGKWYFVTFRLADSLAQPKLQQWKAEQALWLELHPQPWSEKVEQEYHRRFTARFESWLDAGEGECVLRQPEAHAVVASALQFFAADARAGGFQPPPAASNSSSATEISLPTDGDCKSPARDIRYELGDFVVMPNHVHLLVRPLPPLELEQILHSWKSFSANTVNRLAGRCGPVWWNDSFDHLVRNAEKFAKFQRYIANNPGKAGLKPGEYHLHRTSLCYLNTPP